MVSADGQVRLSFILKGEPSSFELRRKLRLRHLEANIYYQTRATTLTVRMWNKKRLLYCINGIYNEILSLKAAIHVHNA